jgi:hypothetical protein
MRCCLAVEFEDGRIEYVSLAPGNRYASDEMFPLVLVANPKKATYFESTDSETATDMRKLALSLKTSIIAACARVGTQRPDFIHVMKGDFPLFIGQRTELDVIPKLTEEV